jgi:hypothetical protein
VKVGKTLSATTGAWTGNPTSYAYAWQRCNDPMTTCTTVIGATGSTYKVGPTDRGYRLRVQVTATNAGGSASAVSAPTVLLEQSLILELSPGSADGES